MEAVEDLLAVPIVIVSIDLIDHTARTGMLPLDVLGSLIDDACPLVSAEFELGLATTFPIMGTIVRHDSFADVLSCVVKHTAHSSVTDRRSTHCVLLVER